MGAQVIKDLLSIAAFEATVVSCVSAFSEIRHKQCPYNIASRLYHLRDIGSWGDWLSLMANNI